MHRDPGKDADNNDDDIDVEDKEGGRPGPVDEGREGGMATREIAPDVIEPTQEPPD